jgi:hypothetical protein
MFNAVLNRNFTKDFPYDPSALCLEGDHEGKKGKVAPVLK